MCTAEPSGRHIGSVTQSVLLLWKEGVFSVKLWDLCKVDLGSHVFF